VTEFVHGLMLGAIMLEGKETVYTSARDRGNGNVGADTKRTSKPIELTEWFKVHTVFREGHAGSKFWSAVLLLLTGLQMFRDGVKRQNFDLMTSGKRHALLSHFVTGDRLCQQATMQSLVNSLHIWPPGFREVNKCAPSAVSQRGGRCSHVEKKWVDRRTSGEAMDAKTENRVQLLSRIKQGLAPVVALRPRWIEPEN